MGSHAVSFVAGGIKSLVGVVKRHAIAGAFAAVALAGASFTAPAYAITVTPDSGQTLIGSFTAVGNTVDKSAEGVLAAVSNYALTHPAWDQDYDLSVGPLSFNSGGEYLFDISGVLIAFWTGNLFSAYLFDTPVASVTIEDANGLNHLYTFAAVPVPAGALLLPAGLALLGLMKWRRKRPMGAAMA